MSSAAKTRTCHMCRGEMQALGIGHHPTVKLPDWWPDHWRWNYYWWNRLEKLRLMNPSPFSGFFLAVFNDQNRWRRERQEVQDETFKLDPALHEAIRHAFVAVIVATTGPDDETMYPHPEWNPGREAHRFKFIDWIVEDYIAGWTEEEFAPRQPKFLEVSTICTKCFAVFTPGK